MIARKPPLRLLALAVATGGLLTAGAAPAEAVISPTSCGYIKVGGKRYQVRTHQVRCRTARPWAVRYLRYNRRPRGWTCRNYDPKQTKFRFMCRRGDRNFVAIRR